MLVEIAVHASQYPPRAKFLIIFSKHRIPTIRSKCSQFYPRVHTHIHTCTKFLIAFPKNQIAKISPTSPSYIRNFSSPLPKNQISKICPKYPISIHRVRACVQKLNPKNLFDCIHFSSREISHFASSSKIR